MFFRSEGFKSMDITTAITIIGSFGAASTAQIVNHILTQKRDEKKYKKEALQNLYSPTILEVIKFIEFEGYNCCPNPTIRSEFEDKDVILNNIIDKVEKNLKYAEAELINGYYSLKNYIDQNGYEDFYNPSNRFVWDLVVEFSNLFFKDYVLISKLLKSDSNSIYTRLKAPYFFSEFYLLFSECFARYDFNHDFVSSYYDLIEFIMLPKNDYIKRIVRIRKKLNSAYNNYRDSKVLEESLIDSYQFFYELADEFSIASEERANKFKDFLDELTQCKN
jgi:hypothetical protein